MFIIDMQQVPSNAPENINEFFIPMGLNLRERDRLNLQRHDSFEFVGAMMTNTVQHLYVPRAVKQDLGMKLRLETGTLCSFSLYILSSYVFLTINPYKQVPTRLVGYVVFEREAREFQ